MVIRGLGENGQIPRAKAKISDGFSAIMKAKLRTDAGASDVASTSGSLTDFKGAVADAIAALPIHSSQAETHQFIHIADGAYRMMRDDPRFYREVMDRVAMERNVAYVSPAPSFVRLQWDDRGRLSRLVDGEAPEALLDEDGKECWEGEPVVIDPLGAEKRKARLRDKRREEEAEARERRLEAEALDAGKRETARAEQAYLMRRADAEA